MNGNIDTAILDDHHRASSRTRTAQMAQDPPQRSSSTRDGRGTGATTTVPIRSQAAPSQTASSRQPSREASEVLNRIIVSQPEVDIERERERQAEAIPHSVSSSRSREGPAEQPAASESQPEETRRGGRSSRHEHASKREKTVKFGEYILGTTIGEGEFGKVKLGWKPDGGAQVRNHVAVANIINE